ncbi:MAG: hypothetical protein ACP6IQ_10570 [Candidatus Njordarchaeia archaeon]
MKNSEIDKYWIFRNFKRKYERVTVGKSLNLKDVNVRDLADGEIKIVKDGNDRKLLIKDSETGKLYSVILTEES